MAAHSLVAPRVIVRRVVLYSGLFVGVAKTTPPPSPVPAPDVEPTVIVAAAVCRSTRRGGGGSWGRSAAVGFEGEERWRLSHASRRGRGRGGMQRG
jgi:hypothetical protein